MSDLGPNSGGNAAPSQSDSATATPPPSSPQPANGLEQQTRPVLPTASTRQPAPHLLGLRKEGGQSAVYPHMKDDYDKTLPEDLYGHETQPNARVWRAYEEEATIFDNMMIGQARDGLDVMLVFVCIYRMTGRFLNPLYRLVCSLQSSPPSSFKSLRTCRRTFLR